MFIDEERRQLLILRKNIAAMEKAVEEMKAYAELVENALFNEQESQQIRRAM